MEKIVSNGERDCTVTIDGTECAVRFDRCYRSFAVENNSTGDVYPKTPPGFVFRRKKQMM